MICQLEEIKMTYTVKQLAKLSGVSSRTLRFYDEIRLLKPAYYGDNQYRYYEEVQDLIRQHYTWVKNFWTPTKETYIGLGKMYLDHPDFREFYNKYHPNLVEYLVEAMQIFAERELS